MLWHEWLVYKRPIGLRQIFNLTWSFIFCWSLKGTKAVFYSLKLNWFYLNWSLLCPPTAADPCLVGGLVWSITTDCPQSPRLLPLQSLFDFSMKHFYESYPLGLYLPPSLSLSSVYVCGCARRRRTSSPPQRNVGRSAAPRPGREASRGAINHSLPSLLPVSLHPPCFCNRQRNPSLN